MYDWNDQIFFVTKYHNDLPDITSLVSQESNGPSDAYAAISNADRLQAEPESLRKWREEQKERLELLGKHKPEEKGNRIDNGCLRCDNCM